MRTRRLAWLLVGLALLALPCAAQNRFGASDFYGRVQDLSLMGRWLLNEGAGTTIADVSADSWVLAGIATAKVNTGTLTAGSGAWSTDSPLVRASFNFSSSSIVCGADASLTSLGAHTYTAWIKPSGWGGNGLGTILSKTAADSGTDFWSVNSTYGLYFRRQFSGNDGTWRGANSLVVLNKWQMLAVTYDHSSAANDPLMYVNGQAIAVTESGTPTGTAEEVAAAQLTIGAQNYSGYAFAGRICDVRVYNRILSANEIQALYEGASSDPTFNSLTIANDATVGGKVTTTGGVHVGGTSDPGADNLLVDGTATVTGPINKVTVTAPATAATLTLANNSTLATSGAYSVTLTTTGATNITLPTSGVIQGLAATAITVVGGVGNIDCGTSPVTTTYTRTPSGDETYNISGGVAGQRISIAITSSGSTPRILTFGTNFVSQGTLSTGAVSGKKFLVGFECIDGTSWWERGRTAAM